jgi:hypothetical protein
MLKLNLLFVEPSIIYVKNTNLPKAASRCFSSSPAVLTVEGELKTQDWVWPKPKYIGPGPT